jgi:hypothetical protein
MEKSLKNVGGDTVEITYESQVLLWIAYEGTLVVNKHANWTAMFRNISSSESLESGALLLEQSRTWKFSP